MSAGVYLIRHRASGKLYVGSSKHVRRRLNEHRRELRRGTHHAPHLQNAWNKHGPDAFDFEQILICAPGMRLFYEQRAIDGLKPAFNTAPVAGSCEGVVRTDEFKAAISEKARERNSIHEWKGQKRSLAEIAEMEGADHLHLVARVCGRGYSVERALSQERRVGRYDMEHDGRTQTVEQWAAELGIHPRRLHYRISEGYSIADVIARLGREEKAMSFAELCRLTGANLQTAKSRVQKGMSMMQAVTMPAKKMDNSWRHKEAA